MAWGCFKKKQQAQSGHRHEVVLNFKRFVPSEATAGGRGVEQDKE